MIVLNITEVYGPVNSSTFELIHQMALEYSKKIKTKVVRSCHCT